MLRDVLQARPLDISASAFVLAQLNAAGAERPVLWVQDRLSGQENGSLYGAGLAHHGLQAPLLHVAVNHPRDALWAMEEAAACGGLSAVVGELHGGPSVLDFTATKRLALRAEASGLPIWLIRAADPGGLSAARERWRVQAQPSHRNPQDPQAPGAARWDVELFRARGRAPGHWMAEYDPGAASGANRLRLVSRSGDEPVAAESHAGADAAR